MGIPEASSRYDTYQNESETATLLNPSPPASPQRQIPQNELQTTTEDTRKHYKRALGAGYMFAMGVCGIVLVALGSTLDDLADDCGTTSLSVLPRDVSMASCYNFSFWLSSSDVVPLNSLTMCMMWTSTDLYNVLDGLSLFWIFLCNCWECTTDRGLNARHVGSVFIARGVGAVLGAIISSKLYLWLRGNTVMSVVLLFLTCVLMYMPFVTSTINLHIAFFLMGLSTAITDTGCQIMTRKLHGSQAGPWLGANTVAFGISGALVPLIGYLTDTLFIQYAILSAFSCMVGVFLIVLPAPEKYEGLLEVRKKIPVARVTAGSQEDTKGPYSCIAFFQKYKIEFHISAMVFCLIGGKVGATAYLEDYVDDTGVISTSHEELLIVVLWMAITVGRLAGLQDQRHLTLAKLYRHATVLFLGGAMAAALILIFEKSAFVLWTCVAAYGLYNGPTVGYCYDLNNRVTSPSEMGMSVVMFGLNFGASIVPYVISWVWDWTGWAQTLIVVITLSHLMPYPLMLSVKRVAEANKRKDRAAAVTPSLAETRGTPSFSV